MNAEELMGRSVVDASDGSTVGRVQGMLVDPNERKVVALKIEKGMLTHPYYISLDNVTSAEHDVVTIKSQEAMLERHNFGAAGLTEHLSSRKVFTEDGRDLGVVHGYEFDANTGAMSSITFSVDKQVLGGLWKTAGDAYSIPIDSVKTLGDHVVVDNSVPESTGMSKAA